MYGQFIKITAVENFAAAGLPWKTLNQARWAFRNRVKYGIEEAFKRTGRTINIDVPRFHELMRGRAAAD
jgi:hypothetical protein